MLGKRRGAFPLQRSRRQTVPMGVPLHLIEGPGRKLHAVAHMVRSAVASNLRRLPSSDGGPFGFGTRDFVLGASVPERACPMQPRRVASTNPGGPGVAALSVGVGSPAPPADGLRRPLRGTQWPDTTLLAPVPHRQVVLTIPKRLRRSGCRMWLTMSSMCARSPALIMSGWVQTSTA